MTIENPTSIFKEVKRLISINDLRQAKILLQPLITEIGDDYRVYALLGVVYHKEGNFPRAVKNYNRALELNSLDTETAINLSLIYNDLGRYEQGAQLYAKAVGLMKNERIEKSDLVDETEDVNYMFANQHASLGELYLRYNKAEDAFREFEKALSLSPRMYHVYADMAECLSRMGHRKQAIKNLKTLKLKSPDIYEARVKLGHLLFLEGEIGPAVEEWDSVIKDNPSNLEAKMYLKMAKEEAILP
jgi:tetratricopeptide (TPR) repeat protein